MAIGSSTCLGRGRKVSRETPGPITLPPQVSITPLPLPCTPSHLCILFSPFSSLGSAAHRRNSLLHLSYSLLVGAPKAAEVLFSSMFIACSLESDQHFQIVSRFTVQESQLGCWLQKAKTNERAILGKSANRK